MIYFENKVRNEFLRLEKVKLSEQDIDDLSLFLKSNPQIDALSLTQCGVDDEALKKMVASGALKNITYLSLAKDNLTDKGVAYLTNLEQLETVDLHLNKVGPEGAKALAKLPNLITLVLSYNAIGPDGATSIARLINLISLDVTNNNIGLEGVRAITTSLKNLINLNLSYNNLDFRGSEHLAMLSELTELIELRLDGNEIGDEEAKYLSQFKNLTSLSLMNNKISPAGAMDLTKMVNTKVVLNLGLMEIVKQLKPYYETGQKITPEVTKELLLKVAIDDREGELIKYFLDRPEEYPFLINSKVGRQLVNFYTHSPAMQQFLFEKGAIPLPGIQEQNEQDTTLSDISRGAQSVHLPEVVKRTNYFTNQLVKEFQRSVGGSLEKNGLAQTEDSLEKNRFFFSGIFRSLSNILFTQKVELNTTQLDLTEEEKRNMVANALQKEAVAFKDSIDQLLTDNAALKISLLDLTGQEKRLVMEKTLTANDPVPSDQDFVQMIKKKAKQILDRRYLNERDLIYNTSLTYDWTKGSEKHITIPESIGLIANLAQTSKPTLQQMKDLMVIFEYNHKSKSMEAILEGLEGLTQKQISQRFIEDSGGLDITEIFQEKQKYNLAKQIYMAATAYGADNAACTQGTWSQIIHTAEDIRPDLQDKYLQYKKEKRAREALRNDITEENIMPWLEACVTELLNPGSVFLLDPELRETIQDLGLGSFPTDPEKINSFQQAVLSFLNRHFLDHIKKYLPNFTGVDGSRVPTEQQYKTIINQVPKVRKMQRFAIGPEAYIEEQQAAAPKKSNLHVKNLERERAQPPQPGPSGIRR